MISIPVDKFDSEVRSLIQALEGVGFTIGGGEGGHPVTSGEKSMARVNWRGHYVGRLDPKVGGGARRGLLGFRFGAERGDMTARCPIPIDDPTAVSDDEARQIARRFRAAFAKENASDPEAFSIWPEREKGRVQFYLRIRDQQTAIRLMLMSAALLDQWDLAPGHGDKAAQLVEDLAEIDAQAPDAATRKRLVDARLGQGTFRTALIRSFGGQCAVSGLSIEPALIASHIVAWRDPSTNDVERADPENGLLLAATVDALFDRHLVTFDEHGLTELSVTLRLEQLRQIGGFKGLARIPDGRRAAYLARHREIFRSKELERTLAAAKRLKSR